MRAISAIFQIISLGRVNPAGADERPTAALNDHLGVSGRMPPLGDHPDHVISDQNILIKLVYNSRVSSV